VVDGLDSLVLRDSDTGEGTESLDNTDGLSIDEGVDVTLATSFADVVVTQTGAASAGSLSDSQAITVGGDADVDVDAVTTNNIETVNLTSTTTDTENPGDRANSVGSVDGTNTQVLNIDGDTDLTLDDVLTGDLQVIDASGFTGALTMAANSNNSQMVIDGGSQADTLLGTGQDDAISGNGGDDDITGGAGADDLTGDAGADTFFFDDGDATGGDVITDFEDGTDIIDLDGTFDGAGTSTDITFGDLTITATDTDSDGTDDAVEVAYTDDTGASTITLQGITDPANITADDFNFA
jgi:Ca2+-binding RTX toxin-like protein